jgi:ribosomal protein S1
MRSHTVQSQHIYDHVQVGQAVSGRVLALDVDLKRLSLTLKPGLLTSKLPLIVSAQQAVPGTKAHALVTGVKVRSCVELCVLFPALNYSI